MDIPGASISVIDDGRIVWARGFGIADKTTQRKVTASTLFTANSITKTLTSLAVVKLLAEKGIALDEPVNRYLTNWKIPDNSFTKRVPVTFRMLLNHTAALTSPYPTGCCGPRETLPTMQQFLEGKPPATNLPVQVTNVPGESYAYCNGCYSVLQPALEAIGDNSFKLLMKELVLAPSNMGVSTFDDTFFLEDTSTIAIPYDSDGTVHQHAPMRNPILSTGLLWTTAIDLARFNLAFASALRGENDLINQKQAEALIIPSSTPTRSLGFFIGDKDAQENAKGEYLFHSGSNIGYLSLSIISKDGKKGAVFLINKGPNPFTTTDVPEYAFITDSLKLINKYYRWD
ncbi:serine hydrolase domain-containing protein [Prochlorococcus sp. MIT 1300]|uniref:serine hydrolase domain-containing protein n=1 Tax=Prochlorococcus sp. MIT 1300 TaxID=3096218 RepID=UPI002A75CF17|nr:serine hydrolase domain-containing protein [Prochlorococcus sp. MIT 1300]